MAMVRVKLRSKVRGQVRAKVRAKSGSGVLLRVAIDGTVV